MKLKKMIVVFLFSFSFACSPPSELNRNKYREENSFPQDFKSTGAYLVLEWNSKKPFIMASGSLVNREKGIFLTAKHFSDAFGLLGVDYCKVFFNGKVYKAVLVKVPPIRDAALIKLASSFSVKDFPEPLPVASENPKPGDRVYVRGFHPHAHGIREKNKEEGFPDKEISIFETYYGQVVKDLSKESQVVFDNLEGTVVKPDPGALLKNPFLTDELKKGLLEFENDKYLKVIMTRDHKFSFGGLSGGEALNEKGEVVGVITAQDIFRFEFDEHGLFFIPGVGVGAIVKKQLFDTIYITPIESIKDLEQYIK